MRGGVQVSNLKRIKDNARWVAFSEMERIVSDGTRAGADPRQLEGLRGFYFTLERKLDAEGLVVLAKMLANLDARRVK
jgi:hypothetical protein